MATDYISREAAIKEFCDDCMDREWCKSNGESCSRIRNINAVPAADVRPVVRAHWIDMKPINMETGLPICIKGPDFRCSNCGSAEFQRNFCPNCGADMRGIENGT